MLQGRGAQPRGAVERAVLVRVQDVREREHRRAGAGAHARLRAQGVQRYGTLITTRSHHVPTTISCVCGHDLQLDRQYLPLPYFNSSLVQTATRSDRTGIQDHSQKAKKLRKNFSFLRDS